MPRKPRFNLVGIPQHDIQRGNNREPCFYSEQDYRRYLDDLNKSAHYCHPVGDDRFMETIEKKYRIKIGQASRGRPKEGW